MMAKVTAAAIAKADKAKAIFLEAFIKCGNNLRSCQAAARSRSALRHWQEDDPEFVVRYAEAKEAFVSRLEQNVIDIADDKLNRGQLTANIFMLKANDPAKYRDQHKVEVTGKIGIDLSAVPDSELDKRIATTEARLKDLETCERKLKDEG